MGKSLIDAIGRERAHKLMGDAVAQAYAESQSLGLPEAVKVDGKWCRQFSDGGMEPIQPPPTNKAVNP